MTAAEIKTMFRERLRLRIGDEMAGYVLSQMQQGDAPMPIGEIPVIGADAVTGIPVRKPIPFNELQTDFQTT